MPLIDSDAKPYNPFIHGTNSSFFAVFAKHGFTAKSPIKMIRDNHAVPITGELTRGGYDHAGFATIDNSDMGKVSLGTLTKECFYDLDKILSDYTNIPVTTRKQTSHTLAHAVHTGRGVAYSNINLMLIYLVRAKQFGMDIDTIIDPFTQKALFAELEATVQFYYFLQLLGTHIFPKYPEDMPNEEKGKYKQALRTHLTFEHILDQIIDNKLDMRAIVANPSRVNIEKVLKILELPDSVELKRFEYGDEEGSFSPKLHQLFGTERREMDFDDIERLEPDYFFNFLTRNNHGRPDYKINDALGKYAVFGYDRYSHEFMQHMGNRARDYLIGYEERIALLKEIFSAPNESFAMLAADKPFAKSKKAFPVILIVSREADVSRYCEEFRAEGDLKLGRDIVGIAVESESKRAVMREYLERYGFEDSVEVVLFDDLKLSAKNGLSPSENAAVAQKAKQNAGTSKVSETDRLKNASIAAPKQTSNEYSLFKPNQCAAASKSKKRAAVQKAKQNALEERSAVNGATL